MGLSCSRRSRMCFSRHCITGPSYLLCMYLYSRNVLLVSKFITLLNLCQQPRRGKQMTEARDGLFVWITWLSKVMAGEQSCLWASWFKTHFKNYEKAPSDFNLVQWTMQHTRLVYELHAERKQADREVFLEGANEIRYEVKPNVILVGKPDVIAITAAGPVIFDVKTGKERMSDQVQVMLYMYLLPLSSPRYLNSKPSGCVVYSHRRLQIPSTSVDNSFVRNFEHFIDILTSDSPAVRVPRKNECRFCEITRSDCGDRLD